MAAPLGLTQQKLARQATLHVAATAGHLDPEPLLGQQAFGQLQLRHLCICTA